MHNMDNCDDNSKNRRKIICAVIVTAVLAIAAITVIILMKTTSTHHGMKSCQELEKEYFDALSAKDYDRLYELTYIPYIKTVVKKQGMGDSESQIKDYYKYLNQRIEGEYGDIKTIKKKDSSITDMSPGQLDLVNGEFEYLGIDAKVSAGAYIELTVIYECEKESPEINYDYYAIDVDGEWYFYSTELAPFSSEEVTNQTEEKDASTEHNVEFVIGYGTDHERVILTKNHIKGATAATSDSNMVKEYVVQIVFTDEGAGIFSEETAANIGEKITILCDGEVVMEPVINNAITDGKTVINNFESFEEAQSFADMLK